MILVNSGAFLSISSWFCELTELIFVMIPYISSTGYPPTTQRIMGHVQVATRIYYRFIQVFLSSTQFSSDQIQNGGVTSDGRLPFKPVPVQTMCQWNLSRCEGLYCLLWRTSERHKDFIHQICKNILTFYEECSCSPDREVYLM